MKEWKCNRDNIMRWVFVAFVRIDNWSIYAYASDASIFMILEIIFLFIFGLIKIFFIISLTILSIWASVISLNF